MRRQTVITLRLSTTQIANKEIPLSTVAHSNVLAGTVELGEKNCRARQVKDVKGTGMKLHQPERQRTEVRAKKLGSGTRAFSLQRNEVVGRRCCCCT